MRASSWIKRRNRVFQKSASRIVRNSPNIDVVVAQYTASAEVFHACSDSVVKVLNYPIAHHRWLMNAMQSESLRNPKWSPLLQGHDFTEDELQSLDREIELADLVLVPCSFAASTFIEYGIPASKISIIALGCETANKPQNPKIISSDQPLQILFAGQATQRKGIGYLVEAIQELPGVELTIVGTCSQAARRMIDRYSNISVVPSLPRDELYRLMQESDLLVLPSLAEGFGLVALEAMANGTPCLLSKETFGPDLIRHGENGYILNEVSTESLASAIRKIQNDRSNLVSVGLRASMTATEYSWERYSISVAKRILELHEQLHRTGVASS
jgi:glycosyltransferase involved in cell wall biosynthesis